MSGSANPAVLTITGNMVVTATFTVNTYTLTTSAVGSGSVLRNNTGPYSFGDVVLLTATPSAGWGFIAWSGDLTGSVSPIAITLNGNKTVDATFTQSSYTLTVTPVGSGSVSLNNTGPYHLNDVVLLTATPVAGWSFTSWSGALSGSANPAVLTITGNMVVTATFTVNTYTLTTSAVGSGSVLRNNTGPYSFGDVVLLTATPSAGWGFIAWSGDLTGSVSPIAITLNGNKTVDATFTQSSYTLTVTPVGSGSVSLNNTGPYHLNDVVLLTATPVAGWSFTSWSGALSGSANPAVLTITGNLVVTATFTVNTYTLTTSAVGSGSVLRNNTGPYSFGDVVLLTAVPNAGWWFAGWSRDASGSANPITITLDGNKTVDATFIGPGGITMNIVGSGSISRNVSEPYVYGQGVLLTAVPSAGWSFAGWSGDVNSSANPIAVTLTNNLSLTATFNQDTYVIAVTVVGGGRVDRNVSEPYSFGQGVSLTAVPQLGWRFAGWSGDATGSSNVTTLTMTSNKTVTATFLQNVYTVSVIVLPSSAAGTVTPNATGPYHYGDLVVLTEHANSGYSFSAWSGDGSGTGVTRSVSITGNMSVTATFVPNTELTNKNVKTWYWTDNTNISSIVVGDVNGDGQNETVTAGSFYDGSRNVAQLVVWNSASLAVEKVMTWYWIGNTTINSVAIGDVNGDGRIEIITGGYYFDGTRQIAQLVVWDGSSLAVEGIKTWYWVGNTVINSVALRDVDGDGQVEVVTGGYYNDGARNVAQLCVWSGSDLALENVKTWYWDNNTVINSLAIGDVDGDGQIEIVTGGSFFDGVRNNAQLVEWVGSSLAVDRLTGWYWTSNTAINSLALGDVDGDGQIEVVTGGCYNDGSRNIAQLVEWNGANLAVDRLASWYWTSNTVINSVSIGDVNGDGQTEIVTGGQFNDGIRNNAQIVVWSGSSMAAENDRSWYWIGNTSVNSIAISNVSENSLNEIVAGGAYYDGTRSNSQLTVWGLD